MEVLKSGKVKSVYSDGEEVIIEFRDDITAGNGEKHDVLTGKGKLLNSINEIFFNVLSSNSIPNHYIERLSETSFKAKKLEIIPLEIVVRNFAAGSFCRRYGVKKGVKIGPVVEFFVKDDELNDPLICEDVAVALNISSHETLQRLRELALKVNDAVKTFVQERGLLLVDFKVEVGTCNGELLIGDEITPDTCRFWDVHTKNSLDKDVYRDSKGDPLTAYREVLRRVSV